MSAPVRMADTLLRHVGGRTVLLRLPAAAVPGDLGEQLGLGTPQFQDVEVAPVVFRRVRAKTSLGEATRAVQYELMISVSAMKKVLGTLAYDSAEVLFAEAVGVLVDGVLLEIEWAASAEAFGSVYLYRLGLRGALRDLI